MLKPSLLLALCAFGATAAALAEDADSTPLYRSSSVMDFWGASPSRGMLMNLARDAEEKALDTCRQAGHASCALAEITSLDCADVHANGHAGLRCVAQAAAGPT